MDAFSEDCDVLYADDKIAYTAYKNFGIKYMFPWQRLVVSNIMEAYDYWKATEGLSKEEKLALDGENNDSFCLGRQIVLLPTGAGKSLCFQVPALLLDGPTLVIYPLLALMTDQQRRMEEGALRSVIFRGGQSKDLRNENFQKLKEGAKIILANPEVLESDELLEQLCKVGIKHIAIDEAHTVSEWGNSFRKSYLSLGKVIKKLNPPMITAFTATASPEVLHNVAQILFDGEAHVVRSESDRPNIHYYVRYAAAKKIEALNLAKIEQHPMIIFCGTRNKAEDMAQELNVCFGAGSAKFYHAGLEKSEKENIEKWFYDSKDGILCATCAYGMGVDKKDIKTVVHLEASSTAEAYLQEAGRGGRDGSVAKAILIWSLQDSIDFAKFENGSRESALRLFAETQECRRQVLLDALGAEKAVCSGCDVCLGQDVLEKAMSLTGVKKYWSLRNIKAKGSLPDWGIAYKIISGLRHHYDEEEIQTLLMDLMNQNSRKILGKKIWSHSETTEVITQLKKIGYIGESNFLWKGRLTTYCNPFLRKNY